MDWGKVKRLRKIVNPIIFPDFKVHVIGSVLLRVKIIDKRKDCIILRELIKAVGHMLGNSLYAVAVRQPLGYLASVEKGYA